MTLTSADSLPSVASLGDLAFDQAPLGMTVSDRSGRYLRVNDAFADLLGRPAAVLLGRPYTDVVADADRARATAARDAVVTGARACAAVEVHLLAGDGRLVPVVARLVSIPSEDGPGQVLAQFVDLRAQRAGEEVAQRRAHALRSTIEAQRAVHGAADGDDVTRIVAEHAITAFAHADGAVVELADGARLVYTAAAGSLAGAVGASVLIDGSLSGLAMQSRRTLYCADTETDDRVDRAACRRLGIRSMCIVPLLSGDEAMGALKISSSLPDAFDEADSEHLELLGESLRTGLRQVREYDRGQRLLAERTEALAALAASEQRVRLSFAHSPVGMLLIDVTERDLGRLVHVNQAAAAITGYPQAQLLGMHQRELRAPEFTAESEAGMRLLAEGGVESLSAERLYRHADGRDIWMRIQATGLPDESGRVTTVLAQLEDVTASRAVARELAQQARLLELIPAAVIVRGVDGGIRWFNAAATELYGWPHDVAAGKTSHKLLATTFPDGLTAAAQDQAILDTGGWTGELQHLSATGRRLTVLSRQVLQPGYDGEPDLILEINTDVTERRAAEQALAESEQRFRGQFQHSAIGQIVRSLDGRLLDVNPAFAAMLGLDREAVIGTSWLDWLDAPSAALSMAEQALLYTGERDAYQAEKGLVCPDGRHLEVHATVSLVRDAEGRPNHIIGVLADITARKAAERERDAAATELARRNEELEAANQLKLDLIGMLGHEIGTPLSVIHGYSELGADEDGPAADHTASRALFATIERNARRLDQVVGEVLALVSVDAGKLVATPRTVRIADHLRTACDTASCAPAVEGDPELTARVQAGHLDQILVNLLTNAHKYGGGCTRVVVARGADETVTVAVHDEGPGVPEDFRDRLFERFSRAADTAGVRKGTGLGLYIVQQLARANRGDVTYSPGAGGGSVFTVRLAA